MKKCSDAIFPSLTAQAQISCSLTRPLRQTWPLSSR